MQKSLRASIALTVLIGCSNAATESPVLPANSSMNVPPASMEMTQPMASLPAQAGASGGAAAVMPTTSAQPSAAGSIAAAGSAGSAVSRAGAAAAGMGGMIASAAAAGMAGSAGAAGAQLGAAGQAATDALDSCKDVSVKVGDNTYDITSKNGQKYSYILSVPKSVDPSKRAPVVIHWHALGSDPEEARSVTSVDAKAEALKTLVVYPRSPDKAWDVGSCCTAIVGGAARDEEVFARELVKDIVSKACVDEKRIYTNGFSNGGMISQMLACKMGDVFAAAAPMGSTLTISPSDCQPKRPIPLLMINGTSDPLVGYDAPSLAGGIAFTEDTGLWAEHDGCTDQPETYLSKGKATCKQYKQCKAGVEVAFCAVQGMGHCVPGMKKESPSNCLTKDGITLGMPNDDIDAIQLSFDFLLRFTLP